MIVAIEIAFITSLYKIIDSQSLRHTGECQYPFIRRVYIFRSSTETNYRYRLKTCRHDDQEIQTS